MLRRNEDPRDTMHGVFDKRTALAVACVLAEASRSLEHAPAGKVPVKAEDYGAMVFVFACLVLTAVTWWCDREHERIFHTPGKGGAVNFDKPK